MHNTTNAVDDEQPDTAGLRSTADYMVKRWGPSPAVDRIRSAADWIDARAADAHRVQPQPDELRAAPSVPPHTLRTLADEVQAAGHTFAANTLRELADGSLVVRTPEIAAALAASPAVPQPDELRALRKLSDAASDGPWEWVGDELVGPHDPIDLEDYPDEDRREYLLAVQHVAGLPNPQPADAALIAAAVNYVRSLLAASPATEARPADDDCERNFCHNGLHHVQTAVDDFDSWPCPKYAAEAIAWYERNRAEAPPAAPDTGQDER